MRNIEHDFKKRDPAAEDDHTISGQIAKQNNRFRKGMNFGIA